MDRTPKAFLRAAITGAASLFTVHMSAAQMSPGMPSTEQTSGAHAAGSVSSAKPMSQDDMKTMKACNAMEAGAMAKHADCKAMMRAHPDMMKHPTTMKSGG